MPESTVELDIAEELALLYFLMVFLVLFQNNGISIATAELLLKLFNAIFISVNLPYRFPVKLATVRSIVKADFATEGICLVKMLDL
jgi:hypothetical protein